MQIDDILTKLKAAVNNLKGSTFSSFDQTPNAVKIIMEKKGRKLTLDFLQYFIAMPHYTVNTSKPTGKIKPKKKSTDIEALPDNGILSVNTEANSTSIESHGFDLVDIYGLELLGARFYEPTQTNQRFTITMDFLPTEVIADKDKVKSARPVVMIMSIDLPLPKPKK